MIVSRCMVLFNDADLESVHFNLLRFWLQVFSNQHLALTTCIHVIEISYINVDTVVAMLSIISVL